MTVSFNIYPPVIAHRGASGYAPENTLAAFTKAAQLGIKWVEFDVMQAACGTPIIFHDELLDRTTNGQGDPSHFPFSYLRSLDAGAWFNVAFSGERIPSLAQGLAFLQAMHMSANVEIKAVPGQEEKLVLHVLNEMRDYLKTGNNTILFSSFSMDALKYLRKYAPECQLGMLLHEWEPGWQVLCESLNCASVNVNEEILCHQTVKEIKAMNKALLSYTVNEPKRALELYRMGVDAVFSDVPDKILEIVKAIHE